MCKDKNVCPNCGGELIMALPSETIICLDCGTKYTRDQIGLEYNTNITRVVCEVPK